MTSSVKDLMPFSLRKSDEIDNFVGLAANSGSDFRNLLYILFALLHFVLQYVINRSVNRSEVGILSVGMR